MDVVEPVGPARESWQELGLGCAPPSCRASARSPRSTLGLGALGALAWPPREGPAAARRASPVVAVPHVGCHGPGGRESVRRWSCTHGQLGPGWPDRERWAAGVGAELVSQEGVPSGQVWGSPLCGARCEQLRTPSLSPAEPTGVMSSSVALCSAWGSSCPGSPPLTTGTLSLAGPGTAWPPVPLPDLQQQLFPGEVHRHGVRVWLGHGLVTSSHVGLAFVVRAQWDPTALVLLAPGRCSLWLPAGRCS